MHSRAVRRATSPGIDTDKSLKDVKPPTDTKVRRPSILAAVQGAGVTKKSKNGRKAVLSAKARRRHEKGLDRAEAVMDKKETKIVKSKDRARTVQERAKAWEEQNKKILERKAKEEAERLEKENWEDEEEQMDEDDEIVVGEDSEVLVEGDTEILDAEPTPQSVPLPVDDEEEL